MKYGKIIGILISAILVMTVAAPLVMAATDTTVSTATVNEITGISVTSSISMTGDPGTDSGVLMLTIDNIGSKAINAVEIKQYITNLSLSTHDYNGTAFVQIDAQGTGAIGTMSYGKLYATDLTTSQPSEITSTNITYGIDKYGVLTLVYQTTSVDGTSIYRAVMFGFTYNSTNDKVCIDTDADGDLSEELWRADGDTSIALTEHRYDSSGADTTSSVATIDIISADTTAVTFRQSSGYYDDVGAIAVDGQARCDYVIYIPNNVAAGTYTGTIEFIAS